MPTHQVSFEFWNIATEDDMFDRLKAVKADGYRGQIRLNPDGSYDMELNAPGDNQNPVLVHVGDVLVRIGGVLESMTSETYASRFS